MLCVKHVERHIKLLELCQRTTSLYTVSPFRLVDYGIMLTDMTERCVILASVAQYWYLVTRLKGNVSYSQDKY